MIEHVPRKSDPKHVAITFHTHVRSIEFAPAERFRIVRLFVIEIAEGQSERW